MRVAGGEDLAFVGEMAVDRQPLDAGALGDRLDARLRRADLAVQGVDRLDDAPAGLRLLLGPSRLGVGPPPGAALSCRHLSKPICLSNP